MAKSGMPDRTYPGQPTTQHTWNPIFMKSGGFGAVALLQNPLNFYHFPLIFGFSLAQWKAV